MSKSGTTNHCDCQRGIQNIVEHLRRKKSTALPIFAKSSILDVRPGSKYTLDSVIDTTNKTGDVLNHLGFHLDNKLSLKNI